MCFLFLFYFLFFSIFFFFFRTFVCLFVLLICFVCIQHYVIKFVSDLRQVGGFLYTTLCDKVCQWLATGRWFSSGSPVSSTNKADRHDITDILLKVALNTIKKINKQNHIVKPGKNIVGNRGHKQIYVKGKKIHCHLRNEYYVTGHTVHDDDRIIS
jgi:hypothetical protein